MEVCDSPPVCYSKIDECVFKETKKEGQLLKIYGKVLDIGKSSLTLELKRDSQCLFWYTISYTKY